MIRTVNRNFGRQHKQSVLRLQWKNDPDSVNLLEIEAHADHFVQMLCEQHDQPAVRRLLDRVVQALETDATRYVLLLKSLMRRCVQFSSLAQSVNLSLVFRKCLSQAWMNNVEISLLDEVFRFATLVQDEKLKLQVADMFLLSPVPPPSEMRDNTAHHKVSYHDVPISIPDPQESYLRESDFNGSYEEHLKNLHAAQTRMKIGSWHCAAHLRVTFDLMRGDAFGRVVESVMLFQDAMQVLLAKMNDDRSCIEDHDVKMQVDEIQAEQQKATPVAYYGVRCLEPLMSVHEGPMYAFEVPDTNYISDQSFLNGGLVLFSAHHFELHTPIYTGMIVTVPGRVERGNSVEKKEIGVRFLSTCFPLQLPLVDAAGEPRVLSFDEHFRLSPTWTVIESPVFYKPYLSAMTNLRMWMQHVMRGGKMPMQDVLLTGHTGELPEYVRDDPRFCLKGAVEIEGDDASIDVQNREAWATRCQMWTSEKEKELSDHTHKRHALDQTQQASLHHIFTNKVAVVEGVPGTGKTFVAMKFVQLLLQNRELPGPIVCMSFTNHTVTSFLNGVTEMVDSLSNENTALLGHRRVDPVLAEKFEFRGTCVNPKIKKLEVCLPNEESQEVPSKSFVERGNVTQLANALFEQLGPHVDECIREALNLRRNWIDHWKAVEANVNWIRSQKPLSGLVQSLNGIIEEDDNILSQLQYTANEWKESGDAELTDLGNKLDSKVRRLKDICKSLCRTDEHYWIKLWKAQVARESFTPLRAFQLWSHPILPAEKAGWDFVSAVLDRKVMEPFAVGLAQSLDGAPVLQPVNALLLQTLFQLPKSTPVEDDRPDTNDLFDESRLEEITAFINRAIRWCAVSPFTVPLPYREQLHAALQFVHGQYRLAERVAVVKNKKAEEAIRLAQKQLAMADGRKLQRKKLIVGTTDSIMTHVEMLAHARPSVLIVEEAAMVLESHVIAALQHSIQHVVLIGDHKQLPPRVMEPILAHRKGLRVSLLERLYLTGAPSVTLTLQRRSHPDLSSLLKTNYPNVAIDNHSNTMSRPALPLASKDGNRLYWLRYEPDKEERREMIDMENLSKYNLFECKAALGLALYLRRCYHDKSVVVLVPYAAQQQLEREMMLESPGLWGVDPSSSTSPVQCRTIDNYQGEEADIVILSLTRTENSGFVADSHRMCVALSRARMALYVVGCTQTVLQAAKVSPVMHEFARRVLQSGSYGEGFPGRCETHDYSFHFAGPEELEARCCRKKCGKLLPCGVHHCAERCHMAENPCRCNNDLDQKHQCSNCGKWRTTSCNVPADCPQFPKKLSCNHTVMSCLSTKPASLVCPTCHPKDEGEEIGM